MRMCACVCVDMNVNGDGNTQIKWWRSCGRFFVWVCLYFVFKVYYGCVLFMRLLIRMCM